MYMNEDKKKVALKKEEFHVYNFNEYITVFIIALLWCIVTHYAYITSKIVFSYFNANKYSKLIKIILFVFYFSGFLYLFQSILLPIISEYVFLYLKLNLEEQWLMWGVTLGITLGIAFFTK